MPNAEHAWRRCRRHVDRARNHCGAARRHASVGIQLGNQRSRARSWCSWRRRRDPKYEPGGIDRASKQGQSEPRGGIGGRSGGCQRHAGASKADTREPLRVGWARCYRVVAVNASRHLAEKYARHRRRQNRIKLMASRLCPCFSSPLLTCNVPSCRSPCSC